MSQRAKTVEEHLSPEGFALRINVSLSTVRRELSQGRLRYRKIGRLVRIPASAGNKWLEAREV
jgi:excisionase family DNA binding protein